MADVYRFGQHVVPPETPELPEGEGVVLSEEQAGALEAQLRSPPPAPVVAPAAPPPTPTTELPVTGVQMAGSAIPGGVGLPMALPAFGVKQPGATLTDAGWIKDEPQVSVIPGVTNEQARSTGERVPELRVDRGTGIEPEAPKSTMDKLLEAFQWAMEPTDAPLDEWDRWTRVVPESAAKTAGQLVRFFAYDGIKPFTDAAVNYAYDSWKAGGSSEKFGDATAGFMRALGEGVYHTLQGFADFNGIPLGLNALLGEAAKGAGVREVPETMTKEAFYDVWDTNPVGALLGVLPIVGGLLKQSAPVRSKLTARRQAGQILKNAEEIRRAANRAERVEEKVRIAVDLTSARYSDPKVARALETRNRLRSERAGAASKQTKTTAEWNAEQEAKLHAGIERARTEQPAAPAPTPMQPSVPQGPISDSPGWYEIALREAERTRTDLEAAKARARKRKGQQETNVVEVATLQARYDAARERLQRGLDEQRASIEGTKEVLRSTENRPGDRVGTRLAEAARRARERATAREPAPVPEAAPAPAPAAEPAPKKAHWFKRTGSWNPLEGQSFDSPVELSRALDRVLATSDAAAGIKTRAAPVRGADGRWQLVDMQDSGAIAKAWGEALPIRLDSRLKEFDRLAADRAEGKQTLRDTRAEEALLDAHAKGSEARLEEIAAEEAKVDFGAMERGAAEEVVAPASEPTPKPTIDPAAALSEAVKRAAQAKNGAQRASAVEALRGALAATEGVEGVGRLKAQARGALRALGAEEVIPSVKPSPERVIEAAPKAEVKLKSSPASYEEVLKGASNAREAVQWLADNAEGMERAVAQRVLEVMGDNVELVLVSNGVKVPGGVPSSMGISHGVYYRDAASGRRAIFLRDSSFEANGMAPRTLLHEAVHAATHELIESGNRRSVADTPLGKAVNDLYDLQNDIANELVRRKKAGEATEFETSLSTALNTSSVHELLAHGFTTPEFQAMLQSIPYKTRGTLWTRFVETVRKLLGLRPNTALEELIRVGDRIMSEKLPEGKALESKGVELRSGLDPTEAARTFTTLLNRYRNMYRPTRAQRATALGKAYQQGKVGMVGHRGITDKMLEDTYEFAGYQTANLHRVEQRYQALARVKVAQVQEQVRAGLPRGEWGAVDRVAEAMSVKGIEERAPGKYEHPMPVEDALALIDSAPVHIRERAEQLHQELREQGIERLHEAGLIKSEVYERYKDAPYIRREGLEDYIDPQEGRAPGLSGGPKFDSGIDRLQKGKKGEALAPMWERIYDQQLRVEARIKRNEARKQLATLAVDAEGASVRPAEYTQRGRVKKPKPHEPYELMHYYEKGEKKHFLVHKELAKGWEAVDNPLEGTLARVAGTLAGSTVMKTATVGTNPLVALGLFPVDLWHSWAAMSVWGKEGKQALYRSDLKFLGALVRDMPGALGDAFTRKGKYLEALDDGLMDVFLAGHGDPFRSIAGREYSALFDKGLGRFNVALEAAQRLWNREQVLRFIAEREGKTLEEVRADPMFRAEAAGRVISKINYGEGGSLTRGAEVVLTFTKAAVAATRGLVEAYKADPTTARLKMAKFAALSAMVYLYNRENAPEQIAGVDPRTRVNTLYAIMPTGERDENGEWRHDVFKLKLDPAQRWINALVQWSIAATLNDPVKDAGGLTWKDVGRAMQELAGPLGTSPAPVFHALAALGNVDLRNMEELWRGGKLNPGSEMWDKNTPQWAKDFGGDLLSPKQLEAIADAYGLGSNPFFQATMGGWAYLRSGKMEELEDLTTRKAMKAMLSPYYGQTSPYKQHERPMEEARATARGENYVLNRDFDEVVADYRRKVKRGERTDGEWERIQRLVNAQPYEQQMELWDRFEIAVSAVDAKHGSFWKQLKAIPDVREQGREYARAMARLTKESQGEYWGELERFYPSLSKEWEEGYYEEYLRLKKAGRVGGARD